MSAAQSSFAVFVTVFAVFAFVVSVVYLAERGKSLIGGYGCHPNTNLVVVRTGKNNVLG